VTRPTSSSAPASPAQRTAETLRAAGFDGREVLVGRRDRCRVCCATGAAACGFGRTVLNWAPQRCLIEHSGVRDVGSGGARRDLRRSCAAPSFGLVGRARTPTRRVATRQLPGRGEGGHATRPVGRSCLWKRGNRPPSLRSPSVSRRATIGVTVDRPSRHARAQRANAAATSCSVPMRRSSCSRASPSTRDWEWASDPPSCRRWMTRGEASAASWYQAPLSTWSASSSDSRTAGATT
jgi:hypothetical protein